MRHETWKQMRACCGGMEHATWWEMETRLGTSLRADLDYGEEVQQSRTLGEWANLIGYKMGSSLAKVYTLTKISMVENFKHGWKIDMVVNMPTLFAKEVLWKSSFLGNLKPSNKNLGLRRTLNWGILLMFFQLVCHTKLLTLSWATSLDWCTSSP